MTVPLLPLNNGTRMPALGFGVFQVPADQAERVVTDALAVGYRHIDTAAAYENEKAVGRAIANSGVPRDELFVTTKLWVQDAGETGASRAFQRSLERLGLDYLDLYLIHQPFGDYYGSWRAMQELNQQGLARAIGVSNFYPDRLVDLIDHNETVPAVNQIEAHPFFQRGTDQEVMRERGVQMESWGPLGQGRDDLLTHPVLNEIATAHDKTVAQVALCWGPPTRHCGDPEDRPARADAREPRRVRLRSHRRPNAPNRHTRHRIQLRLRPPRPGKRHRARQHPFRHLNHIARNGTHANDRPTPGDHPEQRRADACPRLRGLPAPSRADRHSGRDRPDDRYRLIDTVAAYLNEREVGEGIRRACIARDEVFIETKVWINDYGLDATQHAFDKSAGKLGVDQIDGSSCTSRCPPVST